MPRIDTLLLPALLTLVTACASKPGPLPARSKDPTMITGTTWQWEETQTPVEKITSPAPDRYTLLLLPDGRANSRFDCNRGGGSYRIVEPGRISFGTMATTMMACPPGRVTCPSPAGDEKTMCPPASATTISPKATVSPGFKGRLSPFSLVAYAAPET